MERGNEWSVRVTRGIGQRVAYYRKRADLTASMLSARCGELGLPIDRNVIAKLENGHRNSVTVDEVYVLAAALGVAPVMLLFGTGTEETAEVMPGRNVSSFRAARWFCDEGPLPLPGSEWHPGALALYRYHGRHVEGETDALATAAALDQQAATEADEDYRSKLATAAAGARELARQHHERIQEAREQLIRDGWLPPGGPGPGQIGERQ